MNTPEHDAARLRILDLRTRIRDISQLLGDNLTAVEDCDDEAHANLQISIRALQAVAADLESVCDEQLREPVDQAVQQAAVARAKSEVDSGEFDSQA